LRHPLRPVFDFFVHLVLLGGFHDNFTGQVIRFTTVDLALLIEGLAIADSGDQAILEVCIDQLL
jgi:hypothetical protein